MKEILAGRFQKEDVVKLLNSNIDCFYQTLGIALESDYPASWRAAWVIYNSIERNDSRLQKSVADIIKAIRGKREGHQRELLRITGQLEIPEEFEGVLFDICMDIWEKTSNIPSLRLFAFRNIYRIASRYPELKTELTALTQPQYIETLSPGIRNSLRQMLSTYHCD